MIGAATTPTIDDSFMGVRLYIVPAAGGTPEPFVKTEGKLQFPRWSPDGRSIAWLGATTVDDPFAGSVFVAPVRRSSGAADRANVTPDVEGSGLWLGWQPGQPDTLTFLSAERQDVRFYTMSAASRTKQTIAATGTRVRLARRASRPTASAWRSWRTPPGIPTRSSPAISPRRSG